MTLYKALESFNVVKICEPLLQQGYVIDPKDMKIKPGVESMDWKSPWAYVNPGSEMGGCRWYTHIFNTVGFIPRYCRECYKIVIRVGTVYQLLKMLDMMRKEFIPLNYHCKCGIEQREWVTANYGGYLYNRGLGQARDRFPKVLAIAQKYLSLPDSVLGVLRDSGFIGNPEPSIVIKRYCTEYEIKLGPSDKYEAPDWADGLEDLLEQHVKISSGKNPPTPQYLIEHKITEWLRFAHDRGDPTSRLFNGGEPIYPTKVVTYHDDLLNQKEALDGTN